MPARKKYQYKVFDKSVTASIDIKTSNENGVGLPKETGKMRVYEKDAIDKQLEFIGEASADLTKTDENIVIQTGRSMDVLAKTTILKEKDNFVGKKKSIEIELENKTDQEIELEINHYLNSISWTIENNNFQYTKDGTRNIKITEILAPKSKKTLKWDQRVK